MNDLTPNNSPFPSSIPNSPFYSPFAGLEPGDPLPMGAVRDLVGVVDDFTGDPMTPLGPVNELMALRAAFPYVSIVPFPNQIRTVALAQNVAKDIQVPDGAAAVQFFGSGNYYVSNNGNAEIPLAAQDNGPSMSLYKPERHIFYTGGIRSFSVISPDVGCVVTMMGIVPREYPRY